MGLPNPKNPVQTSNYQELVSRSHILPASSEDLAYIKNPDELLVQQELRTQNDDLEKSFETVTYAWFAEFFNKRISGKSFGQIDNQSKLLYMIEFFANQDQQAPNINNRKLGLYLEFYYQTALEFMYSEKDAYHLNTIWSSKSLTDWYLNKYLNTWRKRHCCITERRALSSLSKTSTTKCFVLDVSNILNKKFEWPIIKNVIDHLRGGVNIFLVSNNVFDPGRWFLIHGKNHGCFNRGYGLYADNVEPLDSIINRQSVEFLFKKRFVDLEKQGLVLFLRPHSYNLNDTSGRFMVKDEIVDFLKRSLGHAGSFEMRDQNNKLIGIPQNKSIRDVKHNKNRQECNYGDRPATQTKKHSTLKTDKANQISTYGCRSPIMIASHGHGALSSICLLFGTLLGKFNGVIEGLSKTTNMAMEVGKVDNSIFVNSLVNMSSFESKNDNRDRTETLEEILDQLNIPLSSKSGEMLLGHFKQLLESLNEISTKEVLAVNKALASEQYVWRTIKGVSRDTGIPEIKVKAIIEDLIPDLVQSPRPSTTGENLYSRASQIKKKLNILERLNIVLIGGLKC